MAENSKQNKKSIKITNAIIVTIALAFLFVFGALRFSSEEDRIDGSSSAVDANATYMADIEIENYGTITVALNGGAAPITVENFVTLAREGFYDGLTFHRIVNGYMMQGGDPNGNGTGGSGKTIKGEFKANNVENPLSHTRGAISMARAKSPDSASSQFFIMQQDYYRWDGNYAVFGYVTEGMDVVDQICADAKPIDSDGIIAPEEQPVIKTITIYE